MAVRERASTRALMITELTPPFSFLAGKQAVTFWVKTCFQLTQTCSTRGGCSPPPCLFRAKSNRTTNTLRQAYCGSSLSLIELESNSKPVYLNFMEVILFPTVPGHVTSKWQTGTIPINRRVLLVLIYKYIHAKSSTMLFPLLICLLGLYILGGSG